MFKHVPGLVIAVILGLLALLTLSACGANGPTNQFGAYCGTATFAAGDTARVYVAGQENCDDQDVKDGINTIAAGNNGVGGEWICIFNNDMQNAPIATPPPGATPTGERVHAQCDNGKGTELTFTQ